MGLSPLKHPDAHLPMASRSLHSRLWYQFLRHCLQIGGVLAYGVRYYGRENIPTHGGVLVVCNHQSHFDPPLVGMGVNRRMNYLARDTLFTFPPFRWLIHSVDAIPIDREGVGLSGVKESLRRLKRGEMVVVFPEGTRTRDGEIGRFRPGFTALASRSGAAILPVAVEGAFAAWPRARSFPAGAGFSSVMAPHCGQRRSGAATNGSCSWRSSGGCTSAWPRSGSIRGLSHIVAGCSVRLSLLRPYH